MKAYIKTALLAMGAAAALAACTDNEWNDKLEGFEVPEPGNEVVTRTYTLTDADYTKISTKKPYTTLAETLGEEALAELKTVGANRSFASEEQARDYLRMFLRDSTNAFFTLANGSAVKLTYNVAANLPENVKQVNAGTLTYAVSTADYRAAYGSETNYIDAFSPDTPASRFLANILKSQLTDATEGTYAVVSYNEASQNPIFGSVGTDTPGEGTDTPSPFEPTDVVADLWDGDENVEVRGYVTAKSAFNFIVTDLTGSLLVYSPADYAQSAVSIGDCVTVTGNIGHYNNGLQMASGASFTIEGSGAYNYPTPTVYTGEMIDEACHSDASDYQTGHYVQFTGKLTISGNYYNVEVEGATSKGSIINPCDEIKALLVDGETYTFTGYYTYWSSAGNYFNIMATAVSAPSAAPLRAPVAPVPSTSTTAIYRYSGSAWQPAADMLVLQPADYTAMGQSYQNLSGTSPATLLPIYLAAKFPYAKADDTKCVAYLYYNGSTTAYQASEFVFNGSEWTANIGATTSQFVKSHGFWNYDPSVVITLPYVRNTDPSYSFYMACVNWVFENVGKPMGGNSLTDSPFIDYRGNAEFYSGASAYYGNCDVRASVAKSNAPAGYTGYDGLSDEEIEAVVKHRLVEETFPGALAMLYPDAAPVDGMDVTYTINFISYETGGVTKEQTAVYLVDAPAHFTYRSSTFFPAD